MSASANTNVRIPQPTVWQAFEQGSAILWRKILNDDSLHRFGRNGQAQHGMDMFGYRNGDTGKIVGVQCKCKGVGEQATEHEFRSDLEKALAYYPKLTEYYFTTTAPDDAPLATFAATLTEEQRQRGRNIIIRFWGWGTLEQRLYEHPDIALIFDPNHSPTAEKQAERHEELITGLSGLRTTLDILAVRIVPQAIDEAITTANSTEVALDAEIERYRDLMNGGQPVTALRLLEKLLASLTDANSEHIWFRVNANIGHCYLMLDQKPEAIEFLERAVARAPDHPKARANAVLALTLKGSYEEAIGMAFVTKLDVTPENEVVAAYGLQAAALAGRADPVSLLPEAFRGTDTVQMYYLHFLRHSDPKEWRKLVRKGRAIRPEDKFYMKAGAEADIEDILTGPFDRSRVLLPQEQATLLAAAEVLAGLWEIARVQEAPGREDVVANCINAASAFSAIGEMQRAVALTREALDVAGTDDPDLMIRVASVALEADDEELASWVFGVLPEEGMGLLFRTQIAARLGNWDYLAKLHASAVLERVPLSETEVAKALCAVAWIKGRALSDPAVAAMDIAELVATQKSSARASVLIARTARELGLSDDAKQAYKNALEACCSDDSWASRAMVSEYALEQGDFSAAAGILLGHVDTSRDGEFLLKLATALAYEFPSRARGAGFFADLPSHLRETYRYSLLEGILHYHRHDLPAAQACLEKASRQSPNEIQPLLLLAQTRLRQGDRDALRELAERVSLADLTGTAGEKMNLAHLLNTAGRKDDALKLGYETFDANRNNAKVNLKWIGLSMANLEKLQSMSDATLAVDYWAELNSDDGIQENFLIVEGHGAPADHRYPISHALARAAIGHRAGDVFQGPDSPGRSRVWTVVSVTHKYLHAHLDAAEHFNTRFPDASGFWLMRMVDNDVAPIFELLREQAEHASRILDTYREGSLPIAMIVELSGGNVVKFIESLRINNIEIETCHGNLPEREAALALISRSLGGGVVLDTHTLWTVAGLGATDVLQKLFGEIYLARSSAEAIAELEQDVSEQLGNRAGTSYYHDGKFYFDETTPDKTAAVGPEITIRRDAIRDYCSFLPVSAPDDFDPTIAGFLHKGACDPMFLAKDRDCLLLSEDKRFRAWAGGNNVKSVWLQMAFQYALQIGTINHRRFSFLSARLASLGHVPISCTGSMIADVVKHATDDERNLVHALIGTLGIKTADISSHFRVFQDAVSILWRQAPMSLRTQAATGAMIRNMLRFRPEMKSEMIARIDKVLSNYPGGRHYFDAWKKGHFI